MDNWKSLTSEELDHQMSPSRWNPNKSADEVISQHLSVLKEVTQTAKQRIPCTLDVSYGNLDSQKYDVYGTDLPENATVFFWIHGGYWQEGGKDISAVFASNLYQHGIKTIVLGYTLAPKANIRKIQLEVKNALMKATSEYPYAQFIVGGHSAGGHLAATLLHEEWCHDEFEVLNKRLSGLLLFSGVFDLCPLLKTYLNTALKLSENEAESLSPLAHSDKLLPYRSDLPILLCYGEYDPPEFQRQSNAYLDILKRKYTNIELYMSPKDDHFTLVERLACSVEGSIATYVLSFIKSMNLV